MTPGRAVPIIGVASVKGDRRGVFEWAARIRT